MEHFQYHRPYVETLRPDKGNLKGTSVILGIPVTGDTGGTKLLNQLSENHLNVGFMYIKVNDNGLWRTETKYNMITPSFNLMRLNNNDKKTKTKQQQQKKNNR